MWDRRKFIFVFLRVLQVAGVVQEVLVRNGDTVILNCTCTNHSNGIWDGPRKSTSGISDPNNGKLIPYSTGVLLNPKLNLSKYYIIGSYKTRTCNLMIKQFSSYDEGMYHCQFVENNTANSHFYRVFIKSPIEVAINTTHFEDKINLQCHVSDDPGPYTLKDWEHKSESGKHIRYIENAQDGPIVLNKGNYQNSGIYICRVKNGIHDTNGQHHHGNQVVLHYEGPPVFLLNNSKTWFGQCRDEVNISLNVFSSSNITGEPTLKLKERNDEMQTSEVKGSSMNSTCRDHLVFYNVSVKVPCIEVKFIVKTMKADSMNYSAKVCNKFGCDLFGVIVISTGIPEPPSIISLKSDETKIFMKWLPGLKKGCSKHVFIQYRPSTLTNWTDVGPIPDPKEKHGAFTLSDLYPDIQYEIRMFARNKVGDSVKTNITTISTRKLREDGQIYLEWIVTSVMIVLALICCGLVFVVVKIKEKRKHCHNIRSSDLDMNIQGESVDNRLYLSSDFRQSDSTGNQLEIQPTGQPSSALDSHYLEDITEEQNAFPADQIIPTQHTESNLNYAEVIFEATPSTSTAVVHGKEDRTIYSEIDLLCHVDAIPSSSESDDDFMYVDGIENYQKQTCL